MGVCTKERKGVTAEVLMATPCTNSLGGESGGHRQEGCGGHRLCWKFAAVSWSGAGGCRFLSGAPVSTVAKETFAKTLPCPRDKLDLPLYKFQVPFAPAHTSQFSPAGQETSESAIGRDPCCFVAQLRHSFTFVCSGRWLALASRPHIPSSFFPCSCCVAHYFLQTSAAYCPHAPDRRLCTGKCSRCLPRSRRYRRRPRWGPPSQRSVPFPCQTKSALPWRQKQALTMERRLSWLCGCSSRAVPPSSHQYLFTPTPTPTLAHYFDHFLYWSRLLLFMYGLMADAGPHPALFARAGAPEPRRHHHAWQRALPLALLSFRRTGPDTTVWCIHFEPIWWHAMHRRLQ